MGDIADDMVLDGLIANLAEDWAEDETPIEVLDCAPYWLSKDHGWMKISGMTDTHFKNAIAWIERHKDAIFENIGNVYCFANIFDNDALDAWAELSAERGRDLYHYLVRSLDFMEMEVKSRLTRTGWDRV